MNPVGKYRIIDSHQHVFWHGKDDAALVADMDAHGIDQAWLLTWEIPAGCCNPDSTAYTKVLNPCRIREDGSHPGITLSDLIQARDRYPERFILGYCPNPELPNASELFETACDMYGVRLCGEWKFRLLFDDPRCLQLFRAAGRRGAPVVLHLDVPYLPGEKGTVYHSHWYGGTVDNLERALKACPDTNFIGHAPGFWREISADADKAPEIYPQGRVLPGGRIEALLNSYPNLYADLSAGSALRALKRDLVYSRELLCRFSSRFLFARDYYGGDLLHFLRGLDLPESVQQAILSDNALALLPPARDKQGRRLFKIE